MVRSHPKSDPRPPAEPFQDTSVQPAVRRPVGLAWVEPQRAAIADNVGDQRRQLGDRDVRARADIDVRFAGIVAEQVDAGVRAVVE